MRTIKCHIRKICRRDAAKRIEVIFNSTILSVRRTLTLFENRGAVKVW